MVKISAFCILLALAASVFAFDPVPDHIEGEMLFINSEYHRQVDAFVWENGFKWSNAAAGTLNFAVLAQIQANFTALLSSFSTSTFRQCDRLNSICYQCENGAANVSAASVALLPAAKLFGQNNNMMQAATQQTGDHTYDLYYLSNTPVWTAGLQCRVNATCFPSNDGQLIRGELQGARRLTFRKENGSILIDRINTGARYSYFPSYEAGVKIFATNRGLELVPDVILEDASLTGIFCIPAKRSIVYYSSRGFPLVDEPFN